MIALKAYQERVLDSLREFFRQCSKDGRPEAACQAVQLRNSSAPAALPLGMPYVCLGRCHIGWETNFHCYGRRWKIGRRPLSLPFCFLSTATVMRRKIAAP